MTVARLACLVLVAGILSLPGVAWSETPAKVYALVAERLSVMEDVAAWKHANGKPVEDLEREAVVLEAAVKNAQAEGIGEEGAEAFFQAMIDGAKDIQNCAIARWEAGDAEPPSDPPNLTEEIRPRLIILGRKILGSIRRSLEEGSGLEDRAAFDEAMALDCLSPASRDGIYTAMTRLRFKG
ncbi:MAG: gamma subclass chorismate mutase AroQ [Pseudomonadota bacterium]